MGTPRTFAHDPDGLLEEARLRSNPRALVVAGATLLPWLAISAFTAGIWTALHLLGYAVLIFAIGYNFVKWTRPAGVRSGTLALSPALGVLTVCGTGALGLRVGLSIRWLPVLWLVMALPGAWALWSDRKVLREVVVPYGWALSIMAVLVALIFFLPSARNDAVLRPDGSFNWIYEDNQHFSALAASIARDEHPPRTPGTDTAPLRYHFGPYVSAAVISRDTGLDLGDALVRVARAAAMWALLLSCFGVSTQLSVVATGDYFGGIAAVVGLFFYGSLGALFTAELEGSSTVNTGILGTVEWLTVANNAGPFSHMILGSSLLGALGAITGIMGLCLAHVDADTPSSGRLLPLLALPAFAVSVNSLGGLYCAGIVVILLFWRRLASPRSWLLIVLATVLLLAAWSIMGYFHAPDTGGAMIRPSLDPQLMIVLVWFVIGLGFRLWGLRWLTRGLWDPIGALVLATFLGFLSLKVLFHLRDNNEKYGLYFLQAMFSIFAFSGLKRRWWSVQERSKWMVDWLGIARSGVLCIAAGGALLGASHRLAHRHSDIPAFSQKILVSFAIAAGLWAVLLLAKKRPAVQPALSAVLTGVLLIGFLAWVPDWLNYGQGRMKLDVALTPGEVRGLARLRELDGDNSRFATNKHANDTASYHDQRSYGYTALSGRPALLEGYLARGETFLPGFDQLLQDNEAMFTTTDAEVLHQLTERHRVRWLVARPGTDIALSEPLPQWLVEEPDCGDLKIYRVGP